MFCRLLSAEIVGAVLIHILDEYWYTVSIMLIGSHLRAPWDITWSVTGINNIYRAVLCTCMRYGYTQVKFPPRVSRVMHVHCTMAIYAHYSMHVFILNVHICVLPAMCTYYSRTVELAGQ